MPGVAPTPGFKFGLSIEKLEPVGREMSKEQIKKFVIQAIPKNLTKVNLDVVKGEVLKQLTQKGVEQGLAQTVVDEAVKETGIAPGIKPEIISEGVSPPKKPPITKKLAPAAPEEPKDILKLLKAPKEGVKYRKAKVTALPRGEEFVLEGLPKKGISAKQRLLREKKRLAEERLGFVLKGKPKEIKLTEAKKLELVGKEPATQAQKAQAHIVAKKLKFITETKEGKISNVRYKRLMKAFSGKSSMKEMTREEADDFISAMESVVKRQPWEPPMIPISKKVVPKEFFDIAFKEPGIAKVFTPKEYYQRILGTEPLLKPIVEAHKAAYLEQQNINNWITRVVRAINKQAKVSLKEKGIAKILNKPTTPIVKVRNLLDQYEWAPKFLSPEEAKTFNEIRTFTKNLLERTNVVRKRLGLEPIREVKAYIGHYLDEMAKQIVQKKYPFPEDVRYWLGRNMPAKIYNPTEMERRVRGELEEVFSKDLGKLLRSLAKYDIRDIYLSEPYSILRAELNALGDKIPASTRKEMDAFLRYDIFKYPTELDQMLNRTLEKPTQILNWFLKPFNRVVSNPISLISSITRRLVMGATIWGRPKLAIRNLMTQKLLTMDLYPAKHYLKAQFWKTPKGVMDEIRSTQFYKLSRRFEDIPEGIMKVEAAGMIPYQKSHAGINYLSNVDTAMKVGYYYGQEMVKLSKDKASKFYKYAVEYSKKHDIPLEKL